MEDLIEVLERKCQEQEADGVKVYFHTREDYCFKFIKGDKLLKVIRRGRSKGWDLKKEGK